MRSTFSHCPKLCSVSVLICTVRQCRLPLVREDRRVVCGNGHSFDVARSGYINLLQPQDRRSRHPGDTVLALAARRRLHDRGVTAPLLQEFVAMLMGTTGADALDAGCGDGFYLASLAARFGWKAHGIDISIPATDVAARRYRGCEWVVANADRLIPYSDASFSLVLSINGRMNAPEFRRVLNDQGRLLVAVPAADDLIELRGAGRDRVPRTVATFADAFRLVEHRKISTSAELDEASIRDVLHSVYRPRQPEQPRAETPRARRITFSLDVLMFAPK
jgi:23S rRNA (guanine745-N1)-methyltransferase